MYTILFVDDQVVLARDQQDTTNTIKKLMTVGGIVEDI